MQFSSWWWWWLVGCCFFFFDLSYNIICRFAQLLLIKVNMNMNSLLFPVSFFYLVLVLFLLFLLHCTAVKGLLVECLDEQKPTVTHHGCQCQNLRSALIPFTGLAAPSVHSTICTVLLLQWQAYKCIYGENAEKSNHGGKKKEKGIVLLYLSTCKVIIHIKSYAMTWKT